MVRELKRLSFYGPILMGKGEKRKDSLSSQKKLYLLSARFLFYMSRILNNDVVTWRLNVCICQN
jgi:hypothetical protein